eukprot:TRINITY_DN15996_c0_g1_i1.p1 TRINITY_DN15996_c0_g1~~TRINITY_DN15996_c0_g1_i1.p1  ORF type:complete len:145 (-),score=49.78 TRINITY_DN15996_c0_g1_i1:29-463(-)
MLSLSFFFFLMIRRPPRSTQSRSSAASDVYKRQPLSIIKNDSTAVGDIIKIRDSIGSKLLPVEDDDQFITEDAYAPYLFKTTIDGKFAYETKGTWEVKDALMGGPVSYTHLRAHETVLDLVCRLLLEKKKKNYLKKIMYKRIST